MKVLYIAGREEAYSRTRIIISALEKRGHDVVTCLPPDRRFRHYPRLAWQALRRADDCDVVLVGFYGQFLVPLVRAVTRKPIVFDTYVTTYDTMVLDRGKARAGTIKAWFYGLPDRVAYRLADISILDSQTVIDHFGRLFNVKTDRMRRLFLAVDDGVIHPQQDQSEESASKPTPDHPLIVHFHGEFTPFHGVSTIIRAAARLKDRPVVFQIVGRGITYEADRALAESLGVDNIRFIDTVPYAELAGLMTGADICLGIFGDNPRAELVITNKVIEALGMRKPLITRTTGPAEELLEDGKNARLVPPADSQALAEAIIELGDRPHLRDHLAAAGYATFLGHSTTERLGAGLEEILAEAMKAHGVSAREGMEN